MTQAKISSISTIVQNSDKNAADLDQALAVAGLGWYNIKFCLVLSLFLIAGIVEVIGYSYILPSAKCDLNINDSQRGLIASLPYIAVVVTSFPWGYLVDTRGRRLLIIISSVTCSGFGILAAFMPDMISFTVCKFIASLCIACPAAVPYTFIGEIIPQRHRDLALSITNAMQFFGSALVPLLAWGILPIDIRADFKAYDFRSWRLLSIVYSCTFLVASFFMYFSPESPKYLVSQGKSEEALEVLRKIYAGNTGKSPDEYPIKRLISENRPKENLSFLKSLQVQSAPLVKPPYLKWLCLNGFLLFGIFATINGLFMWVPDVLNRVLSGSSDDGITACQVIAQRFEETPAEGNTECDDSIDRLTFVINSVANISCSFVALAASASLKFIGKKPLLVLTYFILGVFCILINFITIKILFAVLLSSLQVTAIGIGPVNAYGVDIFPTKLRGMAVGLTMMLGRSGSVIGTNVAGIMINSVCEATFYTYGGLLLLCSLLCFLLPKSNTNKTKLKITRL